MGEPAKKLSDDSLDDLGAVAPGSIDDLGAVDAAPTGGGPAPAAAPEHAAEMATFEDFLARGEPLRTSGRGTGAGLGPTTGEAAVRGLGKGASLGHGDEMQGFGAWLASRLPGGGGDIPRAAAPGARAPLSGATDYSAERDAARAADRQAQESHPYAFGAGELGGGAAPALVAGAALAPATAAMAPVGGAALTGGVLGGVGGEGASEAGTAGGVLRDAAIGGAVGAGTGGLLAAGAPIVARGVGNAARAVGGKLEGGADTLGEVATEQKLAGAGAERAALRKLRARPGGLERYAEGMDRMDIGGPLTGVRGHAEQARAAAEAAGAAKDAIAQQLDAVGAEVDGASVGAAIRQLKNQHGTAVGKQLEDIAQEFDAMGSVPWSKMNLERKDWGGNTAWDSGSFRAKIAKKVYGQINEAMADAAEQIQPGFGKSWRAANEDEHIALKLAEIGENKLNTAGNRAMSPTDYAVGATGLATGHGVAAIPAILANKAFRNVEHPLAAAAAGAGSRALGRMASAAEGMGGGLERFLASPMGAAGAESAAAATGVRAAGAVDRALGAGGSPMMADQESPREKRIAQLKEIVNGTGSRAADMATADPAHGEQLAQEPQGKDRDMRYAHLVASDPAFRARERARSQEQEEE